MGKDGEVMVYGENKVMGRIWCTRRTGIGGAQGTWGRPSTLGGSRTPGRPGTEGE